MSVDGVDSNFYTANKFVGGESLHGVSYAQSFQAPSRSIAVKLSWYWNSGLLSAKIAPYRRRHRRDASGGPSTADQPKKGQPAWCDTRSWYELSKAAEMLKIKETDLVKGIHMEMYPHLISERGDKVNAMPPYKSFKFVFVAPEGTTAAGEMSITLREWT
eukprot:scaffold57121_cov32-Attheya_sp.AAC.1